MLKQRLILIDPESWTEEEMRRWLRAVSWTSICSDILVDIYRLVTILMRLSRGASFPVKMRLAKNYWKESRQICAYRARLSLQRRSPDGAAEVASDLSLNDEL